MVTIYKAITLILIVLTVPYTYAASSPDELAKLLIQAIEEGDLKKYESLVYPASLKLQKERYGKMYKKQMDLRFKRKKPSQYNSYEITITEVVNDKDSNIEEKRLRFYENKWAIFPVTPEKRLDIIVKDGDIKTEGEWTVPYSSQVLSRENDTWYMVYPSEIVEID